jgi:hypothetical protein
MKNRNKKGLGCSSENYGDEPSHQQQRAIRCARRVQGQWVSECQGSKGQNQATPCKAMTDTDCGGGNSTRRI